VSAIITDVTRTWLDLRSALQGALKIVGVFVDIGVPDASVHRGLRKRWFSIWSHFPVDDLPILYTLPARQQPQGAKRPREHRGSV